MANPGEPAPTFFGAYGEWMQTPPPSWEDVAWLRQEWGGPFLLKGVTRIDDARRAVDAGVSAISVSNHGGNNLDGTPATIRALPAIAEAVGDEIEILLDGGVRRGSDVIKAVALGARAVMIGRAYLWGLAANGQAGVENVLDIMRSGIDSALLGLGKSSIHELTPDDVVIPPGFVRRLGDPPPPCPRPPEPGLPDTRASPALSGVLTSQACSRAAVRAAASGARRRRAAGPRRGNVRGQPFAVAERHEHVLPGVQQQDRDGDAARSKSPRRTRRCCRPTIPGCAAPGRPASEPVRFRPARRVRAAASAAGAAIRSPLAASLLAAWPGVLPVLSRLGPGRRLVGGIRRVSSTLSWPMPARRRGLRPSGASAATAGGGGHQVRALVPRTRARRAAAGEAPRGQPVDRRAQRRSRGHRRRSRPHGRPRLRRGPSVTRPVVADRAAAHGRRHRARPGREGAWRLACPCGPGRPALPDHRIPRTPSVRPSGVRTVRSTLPPAP